MSLLTIYFISVAISWICILIVHQYFNSDDYLGSYMFDANDKVEHVLVNFLFIAFSFLMPFALVTFIALSPLGLVAFLLNKFAKFVVKYIKMNYQRD